MSVSPLSQHMSADSLYLQAPETPAVSRVRPRVRSRSFTILSNTEDTLCAHWLAVKMLLISLCLLPTSPPSYWLGWLHTNTKLDRSKLRTSHDYVCRGCKKSLKLIIFITNDLYSYHPHPTIKDVIQWWLDLCLRNLHIYVLHGKEYTVQFHKTFAIYRICTTPPYISSKSKNTIHITCYTLSVQGAT